MPTFPCSRTARTPPPPSVPRITTVRSCTSSRFRLRPAARYRPPAPRGRMVSHPMKRCQSALVPALALFSGASSFAAVSFNRDIRPIMADTCFRCHGPDKNSRMAGMRLDIRDEALKPTKSGVTPIVPGDPEHSAIVQRVFATNAARIMPPAAAHKELTPVQKETISRWVAEGAKYEGHWAYQPL